MSTAMQIIKKANRENKGIEVIISGSKTMNDRPPILFKYRTFFQNGVLQKTAHHGEEVVIEADLRDTINKVAYVEYKGQRIKVSLEHVGVTDSVMSDKPAYAFLSKHIYSLVDENGIPKTLGARPTVIYSDENIHGNEW